MTVPHLETSDPITGDSETRSALVTGSIDFSLFAPGMPIRIASTGSRFVIQAPGLDIGADRALSCHVDAERALIVLGEPTYDGGRHDARGILERAPRGRIDPRRLGGRYALVLADRAERVAQLLTDRFGVWPLCWALSGTRFAFSDRADGVSTGSAAAINHQAIYDYLYFHVIPASETIYRDVRRLEAATELVISNGQATQRTTWDPDFNAGGHADASELSSTLRGTILAAVRREADTEATGCFLSGGTDSSTVAGMLKEATGRASTFSIGFDADGYDEMEYARIAVRHFGTDHHEHYLNVSELVDAIPLVAGYYDQPFGNSSAVPAFICARIAREAGVRKLLAGDGGDELFGGNTRYAKQKIFEAWWQLPQAIRSVARPVIANSLTRLVPVARKAASYVDQASVPMPARMETYNLLDRFGAESVFTADFLATVDREAPSRLQQAVYNRQASAPFVDRMLAYDWRFTLADNDLPKVAGTTRLAGVKVGFPLLDDALVDLSLSLSARDKVRGLKLRHFFKSSLTGFLPPQIIAKKKHGFGLPVGVWLVKHSNFRSTAHDALVGLAGRGLIRKELVTDLFSRRLEEHAGYYGEMVWILMMLELWLASRRVTL